MGGIDQPHMSGSRRTNRMDFIEGDSGMNVRKGLWLNATVVLVMVVASSTGSLLAQQRVDTADRPGACPPAPAARSGDSQIIGDPAACPPGVVAEGESRDTRGRDDVFRFDRYDRGDDAATEVAADIWAVHNGAMPKVKAPRAERSHPDKPIPLSFIVSYGVATDHVWRGINWSEYPGEGRERCNQQAGAGIEFDTGAFGVFGGSVWFDWFHGTEQLAGRSIGVPLESNYTAYWRYPIRAISTDIEVGWSYIRFNAFRETSQELYARIQFDDSGLWGTQSAFLNPYVFYAIEYHHTDWTSWLELGVQPRWVMADVPALREVPVVRDFWISPHLSVSWDCDYVGNMITVNPNVTDSGPTNRCANAVAGVELGYDLGHAFNVPARYGSIVIIGFIDYSYALGSEELSDELWGGVKLAYLW